MAYVFNPQTGQFEDTGQAERMGQLEQKMATTAAKGADWQLAQAQEAWDLKKKQAAESSKMAAEFLNAWTGGIADMKGVFGQAFGALSDMSKSIAAGSTGAASSPLYDIGKQILGEYENYRTTFAGAEGEFLGMAKEEALARKGAIGAIQGGLKADYAGVEGRAAADVRTQTANQEEAEARKMMSMGIDPSSGKFGALSRKGALEAARSTALNMNVARRGEKERVTELGLKAAQILDPSKPAGTAITMRKAGTELLGQATGAYKTAGEMDIAKTQTIGNLASTAGQLATAYSQSVNQPMGEMAGYMLGRAGAI